MSVICPLCAKDYASQGCRQCFSFSPSHLPCDRTMCDTCYYALTPISSVDARGLPVLDLSLFSPQYSVQDWWNSKDFISSYLKPIIIPDDVSASICPGPKASIVTFDFP